MTYEQVRDLVIAAGIKEVEESYPEGDYRRIGAIQGFERARTLRARQEFEQELHDRHEIEEQLADAKVDRDVYWLARYCTMQIEWVLKCLMVAGWARPGEPLSGRAAMNVRKLLIHEAIKDLPESD